jgi:hypothetical protein
MIRIIRRFLGVPIHLIGLAGITIAVGCLKVAKIIEGEDNSFFTIEEVEDERERDDNVY